MGGGLGCPMPEATARDKVSAQLQTESSPQGVHWSPDGHPKSSVWSGLRLDLQALHQGHLFAPLLFQATEGYLIKKTFCSFPAACPRP